MDIVEQLESGLAQCDRAPAFAGLPPALERALEKLYAGLERLAGALCELSPGVRVDYELDGIGKLAGLLQQGYEVETEDASLPRFAFAFRCVGQKILSRVAGSAAQRDLMRQYLEGHGLTARIDDISIGQYVIKVPPEVPVKLVFEPAPGRDRIRVTVQNLDGLATKLYSLEPRAIRKELLGEIAKLVLRRENRFVAFTGDNVAAEIRNKLQQRVRARQASRERETRALAREAESRHGRLRGLLRGRGGPAAEFAPARAAGAGIARHRSTSGPQPDDLGSAAGTAAAPAELEPVVSKLAATPETDETPAYAWLIVGRMHGGDTSDSTGRHGPRGARSLMTTARLLKEGEQFRLLDRNGEVHFSGMIAGEYQGMEPLLDFGMARECYVIQYLRDGEWVRMRPGD